MSVMTIAVDAANAILERLHRMCDALDRIADRLDEQIESEQ